jgi:hypothetical protein
MSVCRLSLTGISIAVAASGVLSMAAPTAAWAAAPETPLTEPATSITSISAMLNGKLNPSASAKVDWYFAYSNPNGTSCQEGPTIGGGELEGQALPVTTTLEGLEPDKTYRYCLVATNPETGEASVGAELSFATLAIKPAVEIESASNIVMSDAQLEAQINPNNQETKYRFEYATNQALTGATSVSGTSTLPATYGDQGVNVDLESKLTADTTYYYRAIAENATGSTEGPIQSFTTTAPPVLTTGPAQEIARTAGTLTGTVDPAGLETTYYYQYGTTTAYGQNAPIIQGVKLLAAHGATPVPVRIVNLAPGTLYHYRIVATNTDGTTYSPDETFTTGAPTPPSITTGPANNITLTTATLTGLIDPMGLETSYVLELGTDTNYGTSISGEVGANSETIPIDIPVIQLAPSTTYHYRFLAINPDGRIYGQDQTFTTPVYEHPIILPTTEPLLSVPTIAFPTETTNTSKPATNKKTKTKKHKHTKHTKHTKTKNKKTTGKHK